MAYCENYLFLSIKYVLSVVLEMKYRKQVFMVQQLFLIVMVCLLNLTLTILQSANIL